ncbi:diaminopimelate epimerase [Sphingomonas japonica]|uniref:Diaminopimelate epimerase n=1 Tax=Sphingomonas japonica TaxID=511662 RepID=A0ABX0U1Y3_9SPHN|nr:diaminopimelate epimerase [Sphingomonas japonica]NIJ23719.1 diaminopimelate epimerase [Sphingomonas japonica]
MRFDLIRCHGSGNDFPLIDARALDLSDGDWARIARVLADRGGPVGGDGLLLLTAGDADHAFGMRMFNSDGSESETCLNGLRCVARLGFELLGIDAARVRLKASSAEVARKAQIAPGVVTVETRAVASIDLARVGLRIAGDALIEGGVPGLPSARAFTAVAMPNPHLVSFVDAVDDGELSAIGEWAESAPDILPGRGNVSFVELRNGGLFVRTFERGVGLTDSCGSAMAASTFAAGLTGRAAFGCEVTVFNRGGMVRATAAAPEDGAVVAIAGNATFFEDASVGIEGDAVAERVVHRVRRDEIAAWDAVLADVTI